MLRQVLRSNVKIFVPIAFNIHTYKSNDCIRTFVVTFRLVQLDKLRLKTRTKEEEQALARGGKDPFIVVKTPSQSKGGVAETSIKVRMKQIENEIDLRNFCCKSKRLKGGEINIE